MLIIIVGGLLIVLRNLLDLSTTCEMVVSIFVCSLLDRLSLEIVLLLLGLLRILRLILVDFF